MSNNTSKSLRMALAVLALAGIGVSLYLTNYHFRVLSDPNFQSACAINETFDCDKVNSSPYAKVFGIPLGLYGAAFYVAMLALVGLSFNKDEKFERAPELLFGFSVLSSLLSVGLGIVSATQIGAWCLFCISLYVVNFGMLGVSFKDAGGGFRSIIGRLDKELLGFYRSPLMYVVGLTFFGIVFIGGGFYKEQVAAAEQAKVEEFLRSKPREPKSSGAATSTTADAHDHSAGNDPHANSDALSGDAVNLPLLGHEPIRGRASAQVSIAIFSDFQCPYCRVGAGVLEEVAQANPDKVAIIYKQYPLDMDCNPNVQRPMHPFACLASVSSICAGKQGQFWEMHDAIFSDQQNISPELLTRQAQNLGLDMTSFEACRQDRANYISINQDIEQGRQAQITGTPSIFINGRRWKGPLTAEAISAVVRSLAP